MENENVPKSSLGSHISADRPITNRSADRLNRSGFAEAIAKVIAQWRNKPSLVIGLFGDWGSGKSSIKNLVIEALKDTGGENIPVVEFSPWQVSGQDILFEVFFREIGGALGKVGGPEDGARAKRVARWKRYSSLLTIAATVAKAGEAATNPTKPSVPGLIYRALSSVFDSSAAVVRAGAEGIQAEAVLESLSLSELSGVRLKSGHSL